MKAATEARGSEQHGLHPATCTGCSAFLSVCIWPQRGSESDKEHFQQSFKTGFQDQPKQNTIRFESGRNASCCILGYRVVLCVDTCDSLAALPALVHYILLFFFFFFFLFLCLVSTTGLGVGPYTLVHGIGLLVLCQGLQVCST